MRAWQKIKSHLPLLLILSVAAFLRFFNLTHGQGIHPDERHMIMVSEKLSLSDMNPHSFAYGSFPYYLLWISAQALAVFFPWLAHYDGLFLVGRSLCALFGLVAIALTYFLALNLYQNKTTASIAALLLAFNVFHLQLSRFYTVDVVLTTLCLIALLGMLEIARGKDYGAFLLTGFTIGLALATKISATFLGGPLLAAFVCRCLTKEQRVSTTTWLGMLLLGACSILTFVLVQPYAILDFSTFMAHSREQTSMVRGLWRPPYTIQYEDTMRWFYALKQILLYSMGWPVALAALLGFAALCLRQFRKPNAEEMIILALIIPTFLLFASFQVKFPRYLLPLYPLLFIIAADGLLRFTRLSYVEVLGRSSASVLQSGSGHASFISQNWGLWFDRFSAKYLTAQALLRLCALGVQILGILAGTLGCSLLSDAAPFQPGGWLLIFFGMLLLLAGFALQAYQADGRFGELKLEQPTPASELRFMLSLPWQIVVLVAALLLYIWANLLHLNPITRISADMPWLYSIVLFLLAFMAVPQRAKDQLSPHARIFEIALLSTALIVGLLLRFAKLDQFPWFVHGDEGEHARIAWDIYNRKVSAFALGFFNMPNMANAIQAPFLGLFGLNEFGIRASSALIGSLTLPAFYFMAREYAGRLAAMLGLCILTTFHVHLWFSKVGLGNIQIPLFVCLSFFYLILAIDFRSIRMGLLCGLWLGIAYQSYVASHVLFVVVALALFCLWLFNRSKSWQLSKVMLGIILGLIFGLGPFVQRLFTDFGHIYDRARIVSIFAPERLEQVKRALNVSSTTSVLAIHTVYDLLAPVAKGNRSDWWYGRGKQMLTPLLGSLFLFSLVWFPAYGLYRLYMRDQTMEQHARWLIPILALLLISFFAGLTAEVPAWQRLIPYLPFVILLPCMLVGQLVRAWRFAPAANFFSIALVAIVLSRSFAFDQKNFFNDPGLGPEKQPIMQTYLVHALGSLPPDAKVYLFAALPDNLPTYPTYYNYGSIWLSRPFAVGKDIQFFGEELAAKLATEIDQNYDAIFVFYGSDRERILPYIKRDLPQGYEKIFDVPQFSNSVIAYHVDRETLRAALAHKSQAQIQNTE